MENITDVGTDVALGDDCWWRRFCVFDSGVFGQEEEERFYLINASSWLSHVVIGQ